MVTTPIAMARPIPPRPHGRGYDSWSIVLRELTPLHPCPSVVKIPIPPKRQLGTISFSYSSSFSSSFSESGTMRGQAWLPRRLRWHARSLHVLTDAATIPEASPCAHSGLFIRAYPCSSVVKIPVLPKRQLGTGFAGRFFRPLRW